MVIAIEESQETLVPAPVALLGPRAAESWDALAPAHQALRSPAQVAAARCCTKLNPRLFLDGVRDNSSSL